MVYWTINMHAFYVNCTTNEQATSIGNDLGAAIGAEVKKE